MQTFTNTRLGTIQVSETSYCEVHEDYLMHLENSQAALKAFVLGYAKAGDRNARAFIDVWFPEIDHEF